MYMFIRIDETKGKCNLEITEGQTVSVIAGIVNIIIKHNDTGISVEYWNNDLDASEEQQENPLKSDQIWFDDLKTEDDERGI